MELSPKAIAGVEFRTARKGYDPEEVRAFLSQVARGVEAMHGQAAAADARLRGATAKVQELSARVDQDPAGSMTRALVLAQKTADAVVAEANGEAKEIVATAEERARAATAAAQERVTQAVADAEVQARQAGSAEQARIAAEVASLTSRRDQLHEEAASFEALIGAQRQQVGEAADALRAVLDAHLVANAVPAVAPEPSADAPVVDQAPASGDEPASTASPVAPEAPVDPAPAEAAERAGPASEALPAEEPPAKEPPAEERPAEDDDDIAGELALMAEPSGRARLPFGEPASAGPPTAEVPAVEADADRVREFFEPEPFADDRWMRQSPRD
jgi:cell division initiation protein